jgi:hypothetical protein
MKKVLLHHTCKQDGGEDYVRENAPFFAKENQQMNKGLFLGSGYYLWENDIEQAHHWGKKHYNNQYYIVAFECEIDEKFLIDLDSKEGERLFDEIQKLFKNRGTNKNIKDYCLKKVLNTLFNGTFGIDFRYRIIRVKDASSSQKIKFTPDKSNYTYIGGSYIYFFKNKEDMNITNKRIVQ